MATNNANPLDAADNVERGIAQLRSMLVLINGAGLEAFASLAAPLKDQYLAACEDKLGEIESAWHAHTAPAR